MTRPNARTRPRAAMRLTDLLLAAALVLVVAAMCAQAAKAAAAAPSRPAARPAAAPAGRKVAPRAPAADSGSATRSRTAPRTLDDIHIEGEIPVPQVLFITARDQRRFLEFQHHRYQRSSRELGRATPIPSRLVVTAPQPVERKENPR